MITFIKSFSLPTSLVSTSFVMIATVLLTFLLFNEALSSTQMLIDYFYKLLTENLFIFKMKQESMKAALHQVIRMEHVGL